MKKIILSLVCLTSMWAPLTHAGTEVATVTENRVLLTHFDDNGVTWAECQPLKGEHVVILHREVTNALGIAGIEMARVRVLEGKCQGAEGWMGTQNLHISRQ